jgi:alpha-beta hydrolase superfamily lysophospholipase
MRVPGELPIFLIGQSMGGLVSLSYLLTHVTPIEGLVTLAAALEPMPRIATWKKRLGLMLARFFPRFAIGSGLPTDELTRNPLMPEISRNDPYSHDVITLWGGKEMLAQVEFLNKMAGNLSLPALLLTGSEDRVARPDGTRKLAMRMHSSECTCKIYPGMYHDLVTDLEREQVFHDVIEWLLGQVARQMSPQERRHMIALKQPFWKDRGGDAQGGTR